MKDAYMHVWVRQGVVSDTGIIISYIYRVIHIIMELQHNTKLAIAVVLNCSTYIYSTDLQSVASRYEIMVPHMQYIICPESKLHGLQ